MTQFYYLQHGWSNRYIWFDVIEDFPLGKGDFENRIKKGQLTFSKQSGTTFADLHGSTIAQTFISNNLLNIFKKNDINNFKAYKIKISNVLNPPQDYFYVEPLSDIPYITDVKISEYIKKNNLKRKNIYVHDIKIRKYYADLTKWDGSEFFRIKDFKHFIVTEKLKNVLEKSNLKNVTFEPIKTL